MYIISGPATFHIITRINMIINLQIPVAIAAQYRGNSGAILVQYRGNSGAIPVQYRCNTGSNTGAIPAQYRCNTGV